MCVHLELVYRCFLTGAVGGFHRKAGGVEVDSRLNRLFKDSLESSQTVVLSPCVNEVVGGRRCSVQQMVAVRSPVHQITGKKANKKITK